MGSGSGISKSNRKVDYRSLAAEQQGIVTGKQLLALGMSTSAIKRKVAAGELERMVAGIYRASASPLTWEARLVASSLIFDPPAPVSHRSAAALWKFEGFTPGPVEVTTTKEIRKAPGSVHRAKAFLPAQVTHHRGFFITSPSQTLLDLGAVVPVDRVAAALDSALLQGLTSMQYLSKYLDRFGARGKSGTGILRRLLAERQKVGRTESELERVFNRNVVKPGALRRPLFQFRIFDGEDFVARRDFVYLHEQVAIEVDGWRFHAGWKAWQRDLETDNRLVALGWVVLRFTWEDVCRRPDTVIRRIREVLDQRGQAALIN